MAAKPPSSRLETLKKDVTCCVCLEQFTDPKLLPCRHVFCLNCIMQMTDRWSNCIKCPICLEEYSLPAGGANNFQPAFHINNLIDLLDELTNASFLTCREHNDHLTVYCETCSKVICRDCAISEEHKKHTHSLISECYPKHYQQILDKIDQVKHKEANTEVILTHFGTREKQVRQQGECIKDQINRHAQKQFDSIEQSRKRLVEEVDTVVVPNLKKILPQKKKAKDLITQLKTCHETMEHNLHDWTEEQILAQKKVMMADMDAVTQTALPKDCVEDDIGLKFEKITFSESNIGKIVHRKLAIEKTKVEAIPTRAKQPSTAILTLLSNDDSPYNLHHSLISSKLSSPAKPQSVECTVTPARESGKYIIKYTAFTRKDRLQVQIGDVSIPVPISVKPTPEARGEPVKAIAGLNKPHGIAVFKNGDIVVAENGAHCLTLFDKNGEKKGTIGAKGDRDGYFVYPSRVAISLDDQHILVTDQYRLQKLKTNGICVKSVNGNESSKGEFKYPEGIAVHPITGQIFVADSSNNRIQVFTIDLFPVRTINPGGGFLLLQRRWKNPHDVALDTKGFLYIADWDKNCIRKLNIEGTLIHTFGSKETSPDGHLSAPSSLVVHNDFVYVSEWGNHRVSVFKTSGEFVRCFSGYGKEPAGEGGKLCEPHGIAMDASGDLYVCDTKNNRIVVF